LPKTQKRLIKEHIKEHESQFFDTILNPVPFSFDKFQLHSPNSFLVYHLNAFLAKTEYNYAALDISP
jgi:hypothetical protein